MGQECSKPTRDDTYYQSRVKDLENLVREYQVKVQNLEDEKIAIEVTSAEASKPIVIPKLHVELINSTLENSEPKPPANQSDDQLLVEQLRGKIELMEKANQAHLSTIASLEDRMREITLKTPRTPRGNETPRGRGAPFMDPMKLKEMEDRLFRQATEFEQWKQNEAKQREFFMQNAAKLQKDLDEMQAELSRLNTLVQQKEAIIQKLEAESYNRALLAPTLTQAMDTPTIVAQEATARETTPQEVASPETADPQATAQEANNLEVATQEIATPEVVIVPDVAIPEVTSQVVPEVETSEVTTRIESVDEVPSTSTPTPNASPVGSTQEIETVETPVTEHKTELICEKSSEIMETISAEVEENNKLEILLQQIKTGSISVNEVPNCYLNNATVVTELVNQNFENLKSASELLLNNKEFVLSLLKNKPACYRLLPTSMQSEVEIIRELVKQDASNARLVDKDILTEPIISKMLQTNICVESYIDFADFNRTKLISSAVNSFLNSKGEDPLINLGRCYEFGYVVTKNTKKALDCYQIAASNNSIVANIAIGLLHQTNKEYAKAMTSFEKAIKLGSVKAVGLLAICQMQANMSDKSSTIDYEKVVSALEESAKSGDKDAMGSLGSCFANGKGVAKDYSKAAQWYQKAAELGDRDAMRRLAICYGAGIGVAKDSTQSQYWSQKANQTK